MKKTNFECPDLLTIIFIIALFAAIVCIVTIAVTSREVANEAFVCIVTHTEMSDGKCFVSVKGNEFSKTIQVSRDSYPNYQEDDIVTVYRSTIHDALSGNSYIYKLEERK